MSAKSIFLRKRFERYCSKWRGKSYCETWTTFSSRSKLCFSTFCADYFISTIL